MYLGILEKIFKLDQNIRNDITYVGQKVRWKSETSEDGITEHYIDVNQMKDIDSLEEVMFAKDKKFLVTGIGINIIKNPNIRNYPATNLQDVTKKSISKSRVENKLKQIFEKNLSKLYKIK